VRRFCGLAAKWASSAVARTGARMVIDIAGQAAACLPGQEYDPRKWQAENQGQCALLRDLFGPLASRAVAVAAAWRTSVVVARARRIYEDRRFADMPLLADALERARCDDEDVLRHCLQGEHVRGCWVLDLILSKDR